jgi:hypothetical protein
MAPNNPHTSGAAGSSGSIIDGGGGAGGGNQQGATVAQRLASLKTISGHHHHHLLQPDDKWVPVSWMPHTTLSQTSHVCVEIRSALVVVNDFDSILLSSNISRSSCHYSRTADVAAQNSSREWRVQATIQGLAGLHMVSSLVPCQTPAAAVVDSSSSSLSQQQQPQQQLAIFGANRVCKWDRVLHLPMRWRDLPRDAYLQLEILAEKNNQVVRSIIIKQQHSKVSRRAM